MSSPPTACSLAMGWISSRVGMRMTVPLNSSLLKDNQSGTARLVVELTREVPYRIEEGPTGLTVIFERAEAARTGKPEAPISPEPTKCNSTRAGTAPRVSR